MYVCAGDCAIDKCSLLYHFLVRFQSNYTATITSICVRPCRVFQWTLTYSLYEASCTNIQPCLTRTIGIEINFAKFCWICWVTSIRWIDLIVIKSNISRTCASCFVSSTIKSHTWRTKSTVLNVILFLHIASLAWSIPSEFGAIFSLIHWLTCCDITSDCICVLVPTERLLITLYIFITLFTKWLRLCTSTIIRPHHIIFPSNTLKFWWLTYQSILQNDPAAQSEWSLQVLPTAVPTHAA